LNKPTIDSISSRVCAIVDDYRGDNDGNGVTPDMALKDLKLDSLDVVEIVMEIEDEFNTDLDDTKLENCTTVQQIVDATIAAM
jgi:acyl carrier protein